MNVPASLRSALAALLLAALAVLLPLPATRAEAASCSGVWVVVVVVVVRVVVVDVVAEAGGVPEGGVPSPKAQPSAEPVGGAYVEAPRCAYCQSPQVPSALRVACQ